MSYNLEQLYTPAILSRAANLSDCPTNETLPYRATVFSPLCGSDLTMALDLDDMGHVIGYGHAIRACAFGQASLSIFSTHIRSSSISQVQANGTALALLLQGENPIITAKTQIWPELEELEPVIKYPERHPAVLLPFQAFDKIIQQYQSDKTVR